MIKESEDTTHNNQEKKPLSRAEKAGFGSIAIAILALGFNSIIGFIVFAGLAGFYFRDSQYLKYINGHRRNDNGSLSKNDPLDPGNPTGLHMRETRSNNYK